MAERSSPSSSAPTIDPRSGFSSETLTFHSLHPPLSLPPPTHPISFPSFALSRSPSPLPSVPAFLDSAGAHSLSYPSLITQVRNLSHYLLQHFNISKGSVAFILSPPRLDIPVLYLALLSLGSVVSPSNPSSSPQEILRQISLVRPSLAFATAESASKLPPCIPTVLLDSTEFISVLNADSPPPPLQQRCVVVEQSDPAAILFSSGTTGNVKGAVLTHRNLMAAAGMVAGAAGKVGMVTVPLFHVYGFVYCLKGVTKEETVVVMTERFEIGRLMRAVERFKVTNLVVAPPVLLKMVRDWDGDGLDLGCLEGVGCGGAPIGVELIRRFLAKFPNVSLSQGYGLTESTAGIFRALGPEECRRIGSAGRLLSGCEAKIVDPSTGITLHPCKQGELWVRGPTIMKGYIGEEEATSAILNPEGWLKTGDLCYIDNDGYLFVVDRLKELIKYKGYQVPPAELEHLLQKLNDIIEAAVIPYPDDEAGQVPMAFIVRQPNSTLCEAEVMEFVAKQVAPYKKIRRISFVNSIPKNPAGKILRKDLIKLATNKINPKL